LAESWSSHGVVVTEEEEEEEEEDAREADGQEGKADSAALRPLDVLKGLRSSPQSSKQVKNENILTVLQRNRQKQGKMLS
jgi:hypothetical protein